MKLSSFGSSVQVIVHGASGGIGLALVRYLLKDPAVTQVFATSRRPLENHGLRELANLEGQRLQMQAMNVTDEASIAKAAAAVSSSTDRIDLLIYCVGVLHDERGMRPERRLADVQAPNLLRGFQVNALGSLLVAKHFHGLFNSKDRCVLANLSARVGSIGDNRLGGWYGYRSSKAAQNMITRNLSIELRRRSRGLICVALHPGTVDTDLSQPFQGSVPRDKLFPAEQAARQLLVVIDSLKAESNGRFYAWDGKEIIW